MTDASDSSGPPQDRPVSAVLDQAAAAALRAPSILNTQPWRWIVHERSMELRAAAERHLAALDPQSRMLVTSCGAALDHALISLRAQGYSARVELLPEPDDPELLAMIFPIGPQPIRPEDIRHFQSTLRRHTDRRPFAADPVPLAALVGLTEAALTHGVYVHVVRTDQVPLLASAALTAARTEQADPAAQAELARWSHRLLGATDGVPGDVTVPYAARPVPLRPLSEDARGALSPGPGDDSGARYLILWGDQDGRRAWLRAGRALSAVWLVAAELGLAVSPMTDLVEVAGTRLTLRRMLSWQGHPYVVLRVGVAAADSAIPATARHSHDEDIDIVGRTS
ncbi:Acg family FMN-binding oxidoreductase [Cryptosporangium sp. NPDC048952]|uniref:Acg family FMN-binding oxidoreductase n=1 Tax=Cryptosporangium sp. NPDC048952 TaxID=3363961 RepID=UPI00371F2514